MDFCCGSTMSARIATLYTDGGATLTDVPFLYCRTCGQLTIAPAVEIDVVMYTHFCDTDGVKQASLYDVVDRSIIDMIIQEYPEPNEAFTLLIADEQINHLLDVWNFASQIGDNAWIEEVKSSLFKLHEILSQQHQLQEQS